MFPYFLFLSCALD